MMMSVDSNPIVKDQYLRDALRELNPHGITAHFGMFFLHDLNLDAGPEVPLLPEIQNDTKLVLAAMKAQKTSRPKAPSLAFQHTSNDYPLGKNPTWTAIQRRLSTDPMSLIAQWQPLDGLEHHSELGHIFSLFTTQFWAYLHMDQLTRDLMEISTLEDAMKAWTVQNVIGTISEPAFIPCNAGLPGSRRGVQDLSFSERRHIYFPPPDAEHHPDSKWSSFLESSGYLTRYHQLLKRISDCDQAEAELKSLDDTLSNVFGHLQCLPFVQQSTKSSQGQIWMKLGGRIKVSVNPVYLKIKGIGKAIVRRITQRATVTKKQFNKKLGITAPLKSKSRQKRNNVSSKSLGRRKPPVRRKVVVTDASNMDADLEGEDLEGKNGCNNGKKDNDSDSTMIEKASMSMVSHCPLIPKFQILCSDIIQGRHSTKGSYSTKGRHAGGQCDR
jgi:hypothetical protein